jgi:hypothetical protein
MNEYGGTHLEIQASNEKSHCWIYCICSLVEMTLKPDYIVGCHNTVPMVDT